MYTSSEIRQSVHCDIKTSNRVTRRHIVSHNTSPIKVLKGMTGSEETVCVAGRAFVTQGNERENVRRIFHF